MDVIGTHRGARLLFSALVFVIGLQSMRFMFASLTWYMRDTRGVGTLDLIPFALAPFVLAAVLPMLSRWIGVPGVLWTGTSLLVVGRVVNQVAVDPGIEYWASAITVLAFVGLVPLLSNLGRIGLVGGLLLGLAVDSAIKGLGLSLDLAYQPGWRAIVATVALGLGALWALGNIGSPDPHGVGWGRGARLLSIGPFLFAELLIFQSQGWTSAVTGVSGANAQLRIAILNVLALYLAYKFGHSRLAIGLSAVIVGLTVVAAEGGAAVFNALSLVAVPLAGILWAGLVPENRSAKRSASGFYLTAGLTIFLILGLAYYLPLDLDLGFGQAAVRVVVGISLIVCGLAAATVRRQPDGSLGPADWVLAAGAAVLSVVAFFAALGSETEVKTEVDGPIRFMSYNVHSAFNTEGTLDVEAIARVVEDTGADVVGFQELPRGRLISATTDLMYLLQSRLGFEYVAYFGTTDPVWGNAVMSRYPITDFATDYLPKVGTPMQRGFLGATVEAGDRSFMVISTHLQHINDSSVHDADPEADLLPVHTEQINAIIDDWGGVTPAVLMGDFNARPAWAQIEQILAAGFVDSWLEAGSGDGFTSSAANPMYRIDYIFHTPDLAAVDAGVIQSQASDHFAVVADID